MEPMPSFTPGAQPEVHAKAREILYELSAALEKAGGKKRKRGAPEAAEGAPPANGHHPMDQAAGQAAEVATPGPGKKAKKAKKNEKKDPADVRSPIPPPPMGGGRRCILLTHLSE